jgi:hypothetical protein
VAWLLMAGVLGVALAWVPFGIGAIVRRYDLGGTTTKDTPPNRGLNAT